MTILYYTQFIEYSQQALRDNLILVMAMISYEPFYKTLAKKHLTEYHLIFKLGFSSNTLYRMTQGKNISTKTIDELCFALDCEVQDNIKHEKK